MSKLMEWVARSFGVGSPPPPPVEAKAAINPTALEAQRVLRETRSARQSLREAQLRLKATGEYPFAIVLPPAEPVEDREPRS